MSFAFRIRGRLDDEATDLSDLFELGCTGVSQDGDDLLAWFPQRVELPREGVWEDAPDEDWLGRYHAELGPVRIGSLWVAPTHAGVEARAGDRILWLDPGMAFGTGHHETTRMALTALERRDLAGLDVLDVGAGSGILAIAADLLGARAARGVDIDPDTVPVARANARLNRSRARFRAGTLDDEPGPAPDVLVANLFAELHVRLADGYRAALDEGGALLVTGILADKEPEVRSALEAGFRALEEERDGEWVLLAFERTAGA